MHLSFFGALILVHACVALWFYRRGRHVAGTFNLSCITLLLYVMYLKL